MYVLQTTDDLRGYNHVCPAKTMVRQHTVDSSYSTRLKRIIIINQFDDSGLSIGGQAMHAPQDHETPSKSEPLHAS